MGYGYRILRHMMRYTFCSHFTSGVKLAASARLLGPMNRLILFVMEMLLDIWSSYNTIDKSLMKLAVYFHN